MITQQQIRAWLENFAKVIAENKDYLTELDAAIGDADHGINLNRGGQKVLSLLPSLQDQDIGTLLKTVSMGLISTVGGASGPLYGTFFLRASTVAKDKQELTDGDLVSMLRAGVEGVQQRGKASLGDKTMLDALFPAIDTLAAAINSGNNTLEALEKAVLAAEKGMKDTIPLVAKKGRASYLGDRSRGHQDPGATSSYLLLKTLFDGVRLNK
jgi:dihydroxyacetone kinase-like protein